MLHDRSNRLDDGLCGLLNLCWMWFLDRRDRLGRRWHRHCLSNRLARLNHLGDLTLHHLRHLTGLHGRDHVGLRGGRSGLPRCRLRWFLSWRRCSVRVRLNPLRFDQGHVPLKRFFLHDRFDLCHEPEGQGQCQAVKERRHHPSLQAILSIRTERHLITTAVNEDCLYLIDSFFSV